MDPVSALGLVGAIIGVVDVISRNISSLIDLQSRYKSADLKVGLLIGQLSTLKAALKQIIELMNTSLVAVPQHQQLLHDLKTSLDCCEVVILVLDERLCCLQRREDSGLNVLNRVQFLWDEKSMTDYLNLLNNQINALNLLLTALQCRSLFEQSDLLQSKENRHLFNLVKDDTSSLLWLRDAESCGTDRSVVNEKLELIDTEFDFDREIFSSKVYQMAARSSMIPALLGGQNDGKPAASFPATVTDSNSPMEADVDKCDEQTIQERPVDTYQPTSQLQIPMVRRSQNTETTGSTEVPQGLRPKSVSHLKSPDRLPVSVSKEREKRGSVQAREQVYRKLLQIPVSFKPQSLSPITLQQDLENFKTTENQSVKVIILGSSESGKSTLFKSIYVHQGAYTDDIRRFYKLIIFKNILDNIQSALEAREMFSLKDAKIDLQYQEFEGHRRTWLTSNIEPDKIIMSPEIASAIKALWNEPSVREVVEMPHEYYIMDCAKYYFESIGRIAQPDYLPTDEDIIRARTKTTVIRKMKFNINQTQYLVYDMSSVRGERGKWIHMFESAYKIIFTVDIAAYDEVLLEDGSTNRMREALVLFDFICNSSWFSRTQFVLFLHKVDKLERKLAKSPLKKHFPEYGGDPTDLEQVKTYFRDRFLDCFRARKPEAMVHFTSLSDVKSFAALAVASVVQEASPQMVEMFTH